MSTSDSALCADCAGIVLRFPYEERRLIRTFDNAAALDATADGGCAFCQLIRAEHARYHRQNDRAAWHATHAPEHSSISVYHNKRTRDLDDNIQLRCESTTSTGSVTRMPSLGGFYAEPGDLAASFVSSRPVSGNTSSDACFELAQQWIDDCVHGHNACPDAGDKELPTRVIDVGEAASASAPRLHLSRPGEKGRYAALSYCWGRTVPDTMLVAASLDAAARRLDETAMPRTIREAMQITRRLGLRFLWVDAQCIVQDSAADWLRESARMCDVYNNALVTIQAAAADDASKGCFVRSRADQDDGGAARLRAVGPAKSESESAAEEGAVWVCSNQSPDGVWEAAAPEPLESRGWTLQEGLLSPRVLSFGSRHLSWQCRTAYRSEAGRSAVPDQSFLGLPKPIWRRTKSLDRLGEGGGESSSKSSSNKNNNHTGRQQAMTWALIVERYTRRQLTVGRDKLPALAGLARYAARTRPASDAYLAGMWRHDLPGSLLWGAEQRALRQPAAYRAPSWSWAAVDGPVVLSEAFLEGFEEGPDGPEGRYSCRVLDVAVEHAEGGSGEAGEVGAIVAGYLRVAGVLQAADVVCDEVPDTTDSSDDLVMFLYRKPDAGADGESDGEHRDGNLYTKHRSPLAVGLCQLDWHDPQQQAGVPTTVWCLRVTRLEGLLLAKQPGGRFVRTGTFGLDEDKAGWMDGVAEQILEIV